MKKLIVFILLLSCSCMPLFSTATGDYWNMNIDGVSIVEPSSHAYTFAANPYHSRYITSDIHLPFREIVSLDIGKTNAQPIVLGENLFLMAGDGIRNISLKKKTVVQSLKLQFYSTSDPYDYDTNHQLKASSSQITHIPNSSGWWHSDRLDRLVCGSRDGLLYCFKVNHGLLEQEWCFSLGKGTRYRGTCMFFFDRKTKEPYIAIGSLNKNLYVVNASGNLVDQIKESGEISSSPMTYRDLDGSFIFDRFIYGVDSGFGKNGGYLSSYYASNSEIYPSRIFNKQSSEKFNFSGIPASMTSKSTGDDILIFLSDKEGRLYCFSEKTGILLWQINRYVQSGVLTSNNTPSVDDTMVYFTLTNYKGKAKLVAIDYRKALTLAEQANDPKSSKIEKAIAIEGGDYTGISYSGTTIVDVLEKGSQGTFANQKILLTANVLETNDIGKNQVPSLFAYYANKKENGDFVPVKDAFFTKSKDGTSKLSSTLSFPGGILTEAAVSDNLLMVVDGDGILHVYTSAFEKNLAVTDLSTDVTPLHRGSKHTLNASIRNFSDKEILTDVELTAAGQTKIFKDVLVPPSTRTLSMTFDVPNDFPGKSATIRCSIDPLKQIADETDLTDNIMEKQVPVEDPADIALGLSAQTYETNSDVTTQIQIKSTSSSTLKNLPIFVSINGKQVEVGKSITLPPRSTSTLPVKWHTPDTFGEVAFKACIDASPETLNTVTETNEINNRATVPMRITQPNLDLSVKAIMPQRVISNTWVIPKVQVTNSSSKNYTGSNRVKIVLQMGHDNVPLTTTTDLEAYETKYVSFIWKAPSIVGKSEQLTCLAKINPDKTIAEHSASGDVWANNTLQASVTVISPASSTMSIIDPSQYKPIPPPPGCENNKVTWVESRFDHIETRIVGYDAETYEVTTTHADGSTSSSTRTRRTPIYQDFEIFKDWYFYTHLNLSVQTTPSKLKSGYGFELTCTTDTDTDYDKPEKITGAQIVYAYFPEDQYKTPIMLTPETDGRKLHNHWTLPANTQSVLRKNNHYVPAWFPNGIYTIKIVAVDQNSPGGSACTTRFIPLTISGNMYEDDHTTSDKR